jgi:beta-mannosidase
MVLIDRFGVANSATQRTPPPPPPVMPKTTTALSENWSFKRASEATESFRVVRSVPTEIFLDLLAHGLIPDPFHKRNELDVQWVGEENWIYATSFPTPTATTDSNGSTTEIVFEGLDTYATVTLNGTEILRSDNMFTPYRVDVTKILKKVGGGGENTLTILFESAFLRGKKIREQWPDFTWACWNGDSSRLAVRKAQYHYVSRSPVRECGIWTDWG